MPSNTPHQNVAARPPAQSPLPRVFLSLALSLGALLCTNAATVGRRAVSGRDSREPSRRSVSAWPAVQAGQQQGTGPAPSATPNVRPRTVGPRPGAAVAAPAPPAAPPAQEVTDGAPASEVVDEDEVVRVDTNLVLIPASVVDGRGRAVTDLRLEDFELKVDGETRQISDLNRAETPVNIVLLFDNSQSLSAAREFEKQAALRFFRAIVRPIDRAAIYSISTQPKLEHGFTNNVPGLVRTIESFGPPAGATALFDTIAQAADYIRPLAGRKVVVLVSDGSDTLSDLSFDEALKRTLSADCQVYVIQTRQIEDPNLHDSFSEQVMQKLTEQTGGAVFVPRTTDDLDAAFTQVSLDLSQQYVLSYNPQEERKDNYFRLINVSVKARPQLRVRARKGFYPLPGRPGVAPPAEVAAARGPRPKAAPGTKPNEAAAAGGKRDARGGRAPARASRRGTAPGRVGPAGPDEEERAKPAPAAAPEAEEPTPTFTLTVAESTPTPSPTPTPAAFYPPPAPANTTAQATPTPTPAEAAATAAPPAAAKEEARKKAPASGGVLNSKALNLPRPSYPMIARNAGVAGTVTVEVTIDEQGHVSDARIISGHWMLHQAAVSAARQARFSPATLSGQPIKVKGTINYTFMRP